MAKPSWEEIGARKRNERTQKIPENWIIPSHLMPGDNVQNVQNWPAASGFFTSEELAITESTASEVVDKIASGVWKARSVTEAVCKRASVAQQLINCVTEIYFEEALKRADELDAYYAKEGKTIGPLHGLPMFQRPVQSQRGRYICWIYFVGRQTSIRRFDSRYIALKRRRNSLCQDKRTCKFDDGGVGEQRLR